MLAHFGKEFPPDHPIETDRILFNSAHNEKRDSRVVLGQRQSLARQFSAPAAGASFCLADLSVLKLLSQNFGSEFRQIGGMG